MKLALVFSLKDWLARWEAVISLVNCQFSFSGVCPPFLLSTQSLTMSALATPTFCPADSSCAAPFDDQLMVLISDDSSVVVPTILPADAFFGTITIHCLTTTHIAAECTATPAVGTSGVLRRQFVGTSWPLRPAPGLPGPIWR